jgi:tetratricopeptide (TPR) repeat protein
MTTAKSPGMLLVGLGLLLELTFQTTVSAQAPQPPKQPARDYFVVPGFPLLVRPEIRDELGLSDEQLKKLKDISQSYAEEVKKLQAQADLTKLPAEERQKKREDLLAAFQKRTEEDRQKVEAVLTEEQRHKLAKAESQLGEARKLSQQAMQLLQQKKYEEAVAALTRLVELAPQDATARYNLACALAQVGKADEAFAALDKAIALGYADPDHLSADPDFASLRTDKRFAAAVQAARAQVAKNLQKSRHEPPRPLEGVRTVERQPEGGLRYHLRMSPQASKDKPARLVIWLHPSGGSGNVLAEALTPCLVEAGYALLVPNQKPWGGWSSPELKALFEHSVPDASQVEGIDVRRPILMGFSAGGQAALTRWSAAPDQVGGLILDAAYPLAGFRIDPETKQRRAVPLDPPAGEAVSKVPIYVVVGREDGKGGAAAFWRKIQESWRPRQIPVVIRTPPGGHAWLLTGAEVAPLQQWLKAVRAGQLPADAAPAAVPSPPPAPGSK